MSPERFLGLFSGPPLTWSSVDSRTLPPDCTLVICLSFREDILLMGAEPVAGFFMKNKYLPVESTLSLRLQIPESMLQSHFVNLKWYLVVLEIPNY